MRIVLTGGPGAGKTTLVAALAARGWSTAPDSARAIIRQRKARGLAPRPSPAEFAAEVLRAEMEDYARLRAGERVVFDRGVLDALGMVAETGALARDEIERLIALHPVRAVFVLPPWREIYRQDAERDQDFAEAAGVFERASAWYRRCGYEPIVVPPSSIEQRCEFVHAALDLAAPRR